MAGNASCNSSFRLIPMRNRPTLPRRRAASTRPILALEIIATNLSSSEELRTTTLIDKKLLIPIISSILIKINCPQISSHARLGGSAFLGTIVLHHDAQKLHHHAGARPRARTIAPESDRFYGRGSEEADYWNRQYLDWHYAV